jgi:hypothetical protein
MLVLALLLAVLGLAIGGWLPISPEAVEHMPGTTTPRTFP